MLNELFTGSDSIEMDDANHARFGAARKALQNGLEERLQGHAVRHRTSDGPGSGILVLFAAMLFVATAVAFTDLYATSIERAWCPPPASC